MEQNKVMKDRSLVCFLANIGLGLIAATDIFLSTSIVDFLAIPIWTKYPVIGLTIALYISSALLFIGVLQMDMEVYKFGLESIKVKEAKPVV